MRSENEKEDIDERRICNLYDDGLHDDALLGMITYFLTTSL